MDSTIKVQGRTLHERDLIQINQLIADHPQWHRTQISRELCRRWHWVDAKGQAKDMACRSMLLKLQARELITLPALDAGTIIIAEPKILNPSSTITPPCEVPWPSWDPSIFRLLTGAIPKCSGRLSCIAITT